MGAPGLAFETWGTHQLIQAGSHTTRKGLGYRGRMILSAVGAPLYTAPPT